MAASNINRVVLTGNLTRDPELRSLQSGTSVCSLRIASNSRRKETASGSTSPTTSASPSGAPRARTAPASCPRAARSASTAASTGVSGRRQDGSKRESVEIVAESVQFLGGRDDGAAAAAAARRTTTASPRTPTSPRTRRTSRRSPSARATTRPRTTTSRSRPPRGSLEGRPVGGPSLSVQGRAGAVGRIELQSTEGAGRGSCDRSCRRAFRRCTRPAASVAVD